MPATKQYSRIYFENYPSENTPLNATNLNKLDKGIDDIDDSMVIVKNNLTASDNLTFKFTKSGNQYGYKDLSNNFVPFKTTHTDTYTYPSGSTGGTYDMGVNHQYRYVNASNVYNKGKTDGINSKTLSLATYTTYGSNWSNRTLYTNNSGATEKVVIERHKDNMDSYTQAHVYLNGSEISSWQMHYAGLVSIPNGKSITMTTEKDASGVYSITKIVNA